MEIRECYELPWVVLHTIIYIKQKRADAFASALFNHVE